MNEYYSSFRSAANALLKGVGQIFLQENMRSGICILLVIGSTSISSMLHCILATLIGVLTAMALRYDHKEIERGLYGFNAALVGLAMLFFFEPSPLRLIMLALGSAASTPLAHLFNTRLGGKGYTFPFIAIVWAILAVAPLLGLEPATASPPTYPDSLSLLSTASFGFGQVVFLDTPLLLGLLLFIAVDMPSPLAGIFSIIGLAVGLLALALPGVEVWQVNAGLYGYNAVLSAIALAQPSPRGAVRVVAGAIVATLLQYAGLQLGLTTLTAPFVLSVWLVLLAERCVSPKSHT